MRLFFLGIIYEYFRKILHMSVIKMDLQLRLSKSYSSSSHSKDDKFQFFKINIFTWCLKVSKCFKHKRQESRYRSVVQLLTFSVRTLLVNESFLESINCCGFGNYSKWFSTDGQLCNYFFTFYIFGNAFNMFSLKLWNRAFINFWCCLIVIIYPYEKIGTFWGQKQSLVKKLSVKSGWNWLFIHKTPNVIPQILTRLKYSAVLA